MAWLEDKKRIHSFKEILRVISPYLTKNIPLFIFVSVVAFLAAVLGLATPLLIREAINNAIDTESISLIWIIGGSVLGTAIMGGIMQFLSRYYAAVYAQKAIFDLRNDIYKILQQLSLEFYESFKAKESHDKAEIMAKELLSYGMMSEIELSSQRVFLPRAECLAFMEMYRFYRTELYEVYVTETDMLLTRIYRKAEKFAFNLNLSLSSNSEQNGKR